MKKYYFISIVLFAAFFTQGFHSTEEIPNIGKYLYTDEIPHLFFHPLIVNTKKAFKKKNGFNLWFVTIDEYKKILKGLYSENYMIVDINMVYRKIFQNGRIRYERNPLVLPMGKKPLIISIDDLNYYKVQKAIGTVERLYIDKNGNICSIELDINKKEKITYNNFISVTEGFIKEHPGFSFNGARPIIALTGYEGVFGYPTHKISSSEYKNNLEAVKAISGKIINLNWKFACHTYGHLNLSKTGQYRITSDIARWKKEVEVITGKTGLFIYPYGNKPGKKGFDILYQNNFKIFFSVCSNSKIFTSKDILVMGRIPVDGQQLLKIKKSLLSNYLKIGNNKLLDKSRL